MFTMRLHYNFICDTLVIMCCGGAFMCVILVVENGPFWCNFYSNLLVEKGANDSKCYNYLFCCE
jgi:hypothetical protein